MYRLSERTSLQKIGTGSPLQDLQKELQDAQQVSAQHFQLELDESTAQINSADALTEINRLYPCVICVSVIPPRCW